MSSYEEYNKTINQTKKDINKLSDEIANLINQFTLSAKAQAEAENKLSTYAKEVSSSIESKTGDGSLSYGGLCFQPTINFIF